MTAAALVLLPVLAGLGIWASGPRVQRRRRGALAALAALALGATLALAVAAGFTRASAALTWGAGLQLVLDVPPVAAAVAITVPAVALAATLYAAAHEPPEGLPRLIGLMVAFTGVMELVVVAGDLLTVLIGWELVAAVSWALIGHEWRDGDRPARAAHAFNATRAGGLGLFLAAGATFAQTGGLGYDVLGRLDGPALHVAAAGVLAAAAAKSAQGPFAPWLFSAMAGPTPVSALLHSATMVAAGAYLLIRLQPALAAATWFGPTVLAVGLATALLGGAVAVLQSRAKHLLAASTSAQYGLMLVAVGAGYPLVAAAHLVAHAAFKSLLFLTAGVAISAAGGETLASMRLWTSRRTTAVLSAIASLALAAVPPLGGAWTKEEIVAAATHDHILLGVATIVAGGLSALYIARFQLLAFGQPREEPHEPRQLPHPPGRSEIVAMAGLAAATVGLSVLWVPAVGDALRQIGALPPGEPWELAASLGAVVVGGYAALAADRTGWSVRLGATAATSRAGDWLGLPALSRRAVADPTRRLAARAARFDDVVIDGGVRGVAAVGGAAARLVSGADVRVVDGGVRAVAGLAQIAARQWGRLAEIGVDGVVRGIAGGVAWAARDARRLQTGAAHQYLTIVTVGAAVAVLVTAVWR